MSTYQTERCKTDPDYRKRVSEQAKEYRKQKYNSDPVFRAKVLATNAKARNKVKEEFEQYRKTLACSKCGINNWRVLQFHHKDPETKIKNVTAFQSAKGLKNEIAKCDILCANCHLIVHYEQTR